MNLIVRDRFCRLILRRTAPFAQRCAASPVGLRSRRKRFPRGKERARRVYVYHASPGVDLRIIWTTLRIVVSGDRRADDLIAEAMAFRRSA